MTWILLPGTSSSPGGDRWALEVPRANLRECSSSLEEGEAMSDLRSSKASWSRRHLMVFKDGDREGCSRRRDQLQQRLGDGTVATVW